MDRQEQALLSQSELLWEVMLASYDALLVIDTRDTVIFWSPSAERVFGYRGGDALGRDLAELIVPERSRAAHRAGVAAAGAGAYEAFLGRDVVTVALHASGAEVPVRYRVQRAELHGQAVFFAYVRDLSESTQIEEMKQEIAYLRATIREIRYELGRLGAGGGDAG